MRRFDSTTLKSAGLGLLLTLLVPVATLAFHLAFAHSIVAASGKIDLRVDDWAVPAFQRASSIIHFSMGLLLLGYWALAALLGRGNILRVRGADALLLLFQLVWVAHMLLFYFDMNVAVLAEPLCPWFGFAEEPVEFGFDIPTPCETFARAVYGHAFFSLPLVLLGASAVLRVSASRRRAYL